MVAEILTFYSCVQKPIESISDFVVALKHLSSTYKFNTFLKEALRDKLICGIHNERIKQNLLSEEEDFDKTFAQALILEQVDKRIGLFVSPADMHSVNKINVKKSNSSIKNNVQTKNGFNKAESDVGQV